MIKANDMERGINRGRRWVLAAAWVVWVGLSMSGMAAESGEAVVVIYNSRSTESKKLAAYYGLKRGVPESQVFGFDLPEGETISRRDFKNRLQGPLLKKLEAAGLMTYSGRKRQGDPLAEVPLPLTARIRYLVLCHGVPLKIEEDPRLEESSVEQMRAELRRNEAAVDSELAVLPLSRFKLPVAGLVPNRAYNTTNAAELDPTRGVLMVARLDGPSATVARGLIDKALQAEREGLWGRAYFDARGVTDGNVKVGDDWIKGSAEIVRRLGYETVLDERDERFAGSFPLSHAAFYAGWYEYDGQASGPFARPAVEFMPGAFAYHLHSFSAATVRSATANWVGPFLAKGATISMGTVHEPFLEFTPQLPVFFHRLIHLGFSFGEAAYACQPYLSWQTTVVGDPLYRPFWRKPQAHHNELVEEKSKRVEWSQLKVVNINLATGLPAAELVAYLERLPEIEWSGVLQEKLGDLYVGAQRWNDAIGVFDKALAASESRQQQVRLALKKAQLLEVSGRSAEAYEAYQDFTKAFPEYPDLVSIYRKLQPLAAQLNRPAEQEHYQREIERLSGTPAKL